MALTEYSGVSVGLLNMDAMEATMLAMTVAMQGKSDSPHSHSIAEISALQAKLDEFDAVIGAQQAAIANAVAGAASNAATNAPTNLNIVTTLLGTLTGEVNATNTKQNDLASKYNDLAVRFNASISVFNTLLAEMRAHGLIAT